MHLSIKPVKRISKKTKEEYKKIKWKSGFKPRKGGWLERGIMASIQATRHWTKEEREAAREFMKPDPVKDYNADQ